MNIDYNNKTYEAVAIKIKALEDTLKKVIEEKLVDACGHYYIALDQVLIALRNTFKDELACVSIIDEGDSDGKNQAIN